MSITFADCRWTLPGQVEVELNGYQRLPIAAEPIHMQWFMQLRVVRLRLDMRRGSYHEIQRLRRVAVT